MTGIPEGFVTIERTINGGRLTAVTHQGVRSVDVPADIAETILSLFKSVGRLGVNSATAVTNPP
ncbi:hypothetical protein IUQ79_20830 [Mycobacteroides abscessus subsp. bolletii]|uniref:hypothetical protein n=1 Tax=Mycobacteroides abscessus TaxID=36809 RepID=UPI0019D11AF1|nr:hypothetical protein [Mycobacteroides abscessus]MBN7304345.1 hypothetical protein [Mycobacteroides abscessus subsp. bolletii]